MKARTIYLIFVFFLASNLHAQTVLPIVPVDTVRAQAIAAMLPLTPKGYGDPCQVRTSWNALYASGRYAALITTADSYLGQSMPALPDSVYLAYWTSNESQTSKAIIERRQLWLSVLTWAECLVNDGRYVPRINEVLHGIINQKSWNFPGDDYGKQNFLGIQYSIGLASAAYAHNMAQAFYLLNSKLSAAMQDSIRDALDVRVFDPTLQAIQTNNASHEFTALTNTNNYNAVCLAGVTGAALTVISDRNKRGIFAAIAERYSKNGIAGFLDDGYCSEGMGYYTYGFGHYILLRESLMQATNGQLNIFSDPKIAKIADFGWGMEIINNIYAAIGDSQPEARPGTFEMYYVNRVLGMGLGRYNNFAYSGSMNSKLTDVMRAFPNSASQISPAPAGAGLPVRSYFNIAGVLTVRPAPGSFSNLGATFQGGNNGEHHNHNDVGSFTIISGNEVMAGDPGTIPYTPKLFGPLRYTYKTIASYGHPVPLVAGKQQLTGDTAEAVVISERFTNDADTVVMDISSAYDEPALTKLERTFIFNRTDTAYIEVKDEFTFSTPKSFETALITRAGWQQLPGNIIELRGVNEKLSVQIIAPPGGFIVVPEVISEEGGDPYTRLGIRLNGLHSAGTVRMLFKKPGYETTSRGEWTNPLPAAYTYNFGAGTGTGQLGGTAYPQGIVTTTKKDSLPVGFLPIPPSGSARLTGHADGFARWALMGNTSVPVMRFSSSYSGKVGRFALYDVADATTVTSVFFRMALNDSTTTTCNWQFAIGRTAGAVTHINGTSSLIGEGLIGTNAAIFASVRWMMANSVFKFSFRDMQSTPDTATFKEITTVEFVKGGTYNMEFYCNNSGNVQTYVRNGTTYTISSRAYHMWANNEQLSYNSMTDFPANQLPVNQALDGLVFQGQTSLSGIKNDISAQMRIGNITINHGEVLPVPLASPLAANRPDSGMQLPGKQTARFVVQKKGSNGLIAVVDSDAYSPNNLIRVIDVQGRQITEVTTSLNKGRNNISLNMPSVPPGVYLATLRSQSGLITVKFIW